MSHVYCSECGFQNPEAANYCARCGALLEKEDAGEATVAIPADELLQDSLVGVEGLVVIDTEDAVLVCSADRVQDVKQIIEELERRGWKEHL